MTFNLVVFRPLLGLLAAGLPVLFAADVTPTPASDPYGSVVVCQGEGLEVRRAELDDAFLQFKANAVLRNQPIPPDRREELEAQLLDRIVVTRLLMRRATEADRKKGQERADKFVSDVVAQSGTEAAFKRQLVAMGFTREEFEKQILERAVCEEVVERELQGRAQTLVTAELVKAYYDSHREQLQRPEMVRASHILIGTLKADGGGELAPEEKLAKKAVATQVLEKARKGEDFAALVKQYSDDPGSRDSGGEYTFPRNQMVPEFEAAAFSMQTNQISDLVTTKFGYHIIKLLQKIPAEQLEFAAVESDIRDRLVQDQVQQSLLPAFIDNLKKSTKVTYLNGARAPAQPTYTNAPPAASGAQKP